MAISALDALNTLKAALASYGVETPAEGYKTTADWATESGQSISNTDKILKEGVHSGLVETAVYRIMCGKLARKTTHYRIKPVPVSRKAKK